MESQKLDIKNDLIKTGIFVIILAIIIFIFGGFLGTSGRGFSDPVFLQRYQIYFIFGISALFIIVTVKIVNFISGKVLVPYPIHEPEDSFMGIGKLGIIKNPFLFTLVGILFALFFAFFFAFSFNIVFSSIPQSVTGITNIWSSSIFPLTENLFFFSLFPLIALYFITRFFFNNKPVYWFFNLIIIPLVSAYLWMQFHNLVYGSQEVAQTTTFIFGFMWVFFTMLFMSQIIGLILHFFINFAVATRQAGLFGADYFGITLIAVWVMILIITIVYARNLKKSRATS